MAIGDGVLKALYASISVELIVSSFVYHSLMELAAMLSAVYEPFTWDASEGD